VIRAAQNGTDGTRIYMLREPNNPGESYHWRISFPGTKSSEFGLLFLDYVEINGISLNRPLVSLDFSAF
jgi:hypothetical protein